MSADRVVYLDSSALVKLVVEESESNALMDYLSAHGSRASCTLARVEVLRAVRPQGEPAIARARQLLDRVSLLRLDEVLLEAAANLTDSTLRSLDAIHLAAAVALGDGLAAVVTYDRRMTEAARGMGLNVTAPATR